METLQLDGASLDLPDVVRVARGALSLGLAPAARRRMEESRAWVVRAARGEVVDEGGAPLPVYGVNTGFGSLAHKRIGREDSRWLSWNLVQSHAAGVGPVVPREVVRAMILLRANALAKGASGCRPVLVETLLRMLEEDVLPEVPSQGSCGSSGDLAPLAHLALAVFRSPEEGADGPSGHAWYRGERLPAAEAMARAGIPRLVPAHKEGLAMCNGGQLTAAFAVLACEDAVRILHAAEIAAAMSWEALRGVTRSLLPAVHALRPYPGALAVIDDLGRLLEGSELTDSLPEKVQDAYSLRCTPEVLGAARDAMTYVRRQVRIEVNAATDNPLILVDLDDPNKAVSAGLFHGEPVGVACDHLKLALCEVGAIAERRLYRLTTGTLSGRLPPLLVRPDRPGLGLMVPQATAAALVSESRSLAWPASVDSIPTCEDQEDHVAMSTTAARRAAQVVENTRNVVAIELLAAAHGLWWRQAEEGASRLGRGTAAALARVEAAIGRGGLETPSEDIARLAEIIADGSLVADAEAAVGPLRGVDGG